MTDNIWSGTQNTTTPSSYFGNHDKLDNNTMTPKIWITNTNTNTPSSVWDTNTTTPSSNFPVEDKTIIKYLTFVTGILSIIGSLLIIFTFIKSSVVRAKTLRKMLVVLSIFDLCSSVGYIAMVTHPHIGDEDPADIKFCNFFALITIYFPVASFIATDGIALFAYLELSAQSTPRVKESKYILPVYIAACLIIPGILTILVASLNVEGYDPAFHTGTCWIWGKWSPVEKFGYQILAGKGVEWISFVFVVCCYVPTVLRLWNILSVSRNPEIRTMLLRLALVPGVFIFLRLPSAMHTILMNFSSGSFNVKLLTAAQAIGDTGQGCANGLLYVVFSDTIHKIFCRGGLCLCCCCNGSKNENDSENNVDSSEYERVSIGSTSPNFETRDQVSTLTDPLLDVSSHESYTSVASGERILYCSEEEHKFLTRSMSAFHNKEEERTSIEEEVPQRKTSERRMTHILNSITIEGVSNGKEEEHTSIEEEVPQRKKSERRMTHILNSITIEGVVNGAPSSPRESNTKNKMFKAVVKCTAALNPNE